MTAKNKKKVIKANKNDVSVHNIKVVVVRTDYPLEEGYDHWEVSEPNTEHLKLQTPMGTVEHYHKEELLALAKAIIENFGKGK